MKILFIANPHLDLYKDIEAELQKQGHEVMTIADKILKIDPFYKSGNFLFLKKILFSISNVHTSFWKRIIRINAHLSERYDLLLALSGSSIGEYLIKYLEAKNPNIRKVLYTWDSCNYYNFNRLVQWFDKCYTFDLLDAQESTHWKLLPIYYIPSTLSHEVQEKYDLFCIGTNHDGRYTLLKRIMPQLIDNKLKFYIKLVELRNSVPLKSKLKYCLKKYLSPIENEEFLDEMEFVMGNDEIGVASDEIVNRDEYDRYSNMSNCILDSQREGQSGLTARFVWALANGQKIITTNKYVVDYAFINAGQVCIIDKMNPVVPVDFIKSPLCEENVTDVTFLRIDNWVKELLA